MVLHLRYMKRPSGTYLFCNAMYEKENLIEENNACNDNTLVIIGPSIVISPDYPAAYGNNLYCRWHIKLPERDYQQGKTTILFLQQCILQSISI